MSRDRIPDPQYVKADHVIDEMAEFGRHRIETLSTARVAVLAVLAGAFISAGALFSVVLATGVEQEGPRRLLEGFGFSVGFFFVVLAEAVLFTEANVVLPATVLESRRASLRLVRFWAIAWAANLAGAVTIGWLIHAAQNYPTGIEQTLQHVIELKMQYRERGTVAAWFEALLSGVLANWLVGMAAFFAFMGRTIVGKFVPVFVAVSLFVAANFQHSPANMGYFGLAMPGGDGPGWGAALAWNIVPAGIGNVLGGALLVALPFWFVFTRGRVGGR